MDAANISVFTNNKREKLGVAACDHPPGKPIAKLERLDHGFFRGKFNGYLFIDFGMESFDRSMAIYRLRGNEPLLRRRYHVGNYVLEGSTLVDPSSPLSTEEANNEKAKKCAENGCKMGCWREVSSARREINLSGETPKETLSNFHCEKEYLP